MKSQKGRKREAVEKYGQVLEGIVGEKCAADTAAQRRYVQGKDMAWAQLQAEFDAIDAEEEGA